MNSILVISYLVASISFILGLKMLAKPNSARQGNLVAAAGMALAIFATIFLYKNEQGIAIGNWAWIFGGLLVGTLGGAISAKRVKMTAMPQMVSLFNGMGGICAALISIIEFQHYQHSNNTSLSTLIMIALGLVIGTVSFTGSMIAWGKLEDKIKDIRLSFSQILNIGLLIAIVILTVLLVMYPSNTMLYTLFVVSALYGVFFVFPIGGADMPVVISLLNSFTGVAAAMGGFLYSNQAMLTGGILVGSAGTILTVMMCKAMNRSLTNVIVGAIGNAAVGTAAPAGVQGDIREVSSSDLAVLLAYAKRVKIVPGYGLAVAQAQQVVRELEKMLEENGVEVKYAIHPVAGRMPGHMNVLLAEADVPYEKLQEMEEANPEMDATDVVMVIGANDVVNPSARTDKSSPIYGMPILDVDKAANVIVLKRSMGKGYAGVDNILFFDKKTRMYFGDAKDSLTRLIAELKQI
jgi:NAD(P) transhydrogenase subunit beta